MLVTPDFVMLNFPKTGSTFSRKAIKEVYARDPGLKRNRLILSFFGNKPVRDLLLIPEFTGMPPLESQPSWKSQHAGYSQIPKKYRHLPVVSVVRNPYSRVLSKFRFKFWTKKQSFTIDSEFSRKFPNFPDLSFEEYLDFNDYLVKKNFAAWHIDADIGQQSLVFLRMYYEDLPRIFSLLEEDKRAKIINSVKSLVFLRQENLTNELIAFLKPFGLTEVGENIILKMKPANVTEGIREKGLELTDDHRDRIRKSEWLIFDVLRNKGIDYSA